MTVAQPTWDDPTEGYANNVMANVQSIFGSTTDGRRRDQGPYYAFGALEYESQTPPTQLPAVQWMQSDGVVNRVHEMTTNSTTGSLASWAVEFKVKFYGINRSQACTEFWYFRCALGLDEPNPPIQDFTTKWLEPGRAQSNRKETLEVTFVAPMAMPLPPQNWATVEVISASLGFLTGTSSFPIPFNTGSLNYVRSVVVR